MTFIDVICDADNELPVPSAWRKQLELIAQAFNAPDPSTALSEIENVSYRDGIVKINLGQIEDYPASRVFVGAKTWMRSIYLWQEGCWDVLVDLHIVDLHIDDERDEVSDLVLPVKVTLVGNEFHFETNFIHVP